MDGRFTILARNTMPIRYPYRTAGAAFVPVLLLLMVGVGTGCESSQQAAYLAHRRVPAESASFVSKLAMTGIEEPGRDDRARTELAAVDPYRE